MEEENGATIAIDSGYGWVGSASGAAYKKVPASEHSPCFPGPEDALEHLEQFNFEKN